MSRGTGAIGPGGLSAYGVNLTPPAPISYSMTGNLGNISNVIGQVNTAQNQANTANDTRYQQLLGVLGAGATGLNSNSQSAIGASQQGYQQAVGSLGNSLANNQTVYNAQAQQATQDAMKASSTANQSAVDRGLSNTTIQDSLQQGVQNTKNTALTNIAAAKATSDNTVYQNLANLYAAGGTSAAGLYNQAGQNYEQGATTLGSAIQARNDVAPSISDYAGVIQGAAAAQNSNGRNVIQTTVPDVSPLGQRIGGGGTAGGSGGGLSGGIGSTTGQGGFNQSSGGGSGGSGTIGRIVTGGNTDYSGGGFIDSLPGGTSGGGGATNWPGQSDPQFVSDDSDSSRPPETATPAAAPAGQQAQDPNWDYTPGAQHSDGAWTVHNAWLAKNANGRA